MELESLTIANRRSLDAYLELEVSIEKGSFKMMDLILEALKTACNE